MDTKFAGMATTFNLSDVFNMRYHNNNNVMNNNNIIFFTRISIITLLSRHLEEIWSRYCDKVFVFSSSNLVNLKTQLEKRGVTTASAIQKVECITKHLQFKLCMETKTTRPYNIWYDFG